MCHLHTIDVICIYALIRNLSPTSQTSKDTRTMLLDVSKQAKLKCVWFVIKGIVDFMITFQPLGVQLTNSFPQFERKADKLGTGCMQSLSEI